MGEVAHAPPIGPSCALTGVCDQLSGAGRSDGCVRPVVGCGGSVAFVRAICSTLRRTMTYRVTPLRAWFPKKVARNSLSTISNIEVASLESCGLLGCSEK